MRYDGEGDRDPEWMDGSIRRALVGLEVCNRCRMLRRSAHGEYRLPSRRRIHEALDALLAFLFPGCHGQGESDGSEDVGRREHCLRTTIRDLIDQSESAFRYACERGDCVDCGDCRQKAQKSVRGLLDALPEIRAALQEDIEAAFDGDPAAKSPMEVVMSYPAIHAIATHRIAHVLHTNSVPLIPRVMSERAHSLTGIDIHPGATIGHRFFIDHGTGVVIGETTVIGDNVKLYQGVTLGALSFPKDSRGNPVKGMKRHPEVRDGVTIYAEATILGGDTVIGEGSEIGGNVWLTHSVPPHSRVYNVQPAPHVREKRQTRDAAGLSHGDPAI